MPSYVVLLHCTQKGIETIERGLPRLDRAKQVFKAAGGELKAGCPVTGRYDAVAIVEASNGEVVARLALGNASLGNIRSETLRAFTEDEYRKLIASLP